MLPITIFSKFPDKALTEVPTEASDEKSADKPTNKIGLLINNKKTRRLLILLALVGLSGVAGWKIYQGIVSPPDEETSELISNPVRLPVRVTHAKKGLAQGWTFDEGISLPVQLRVLNFYASGNITYVAKNNATPLKEGDFVARGDLLATIDDRRQASGIDTSQADIEVAINRKEQARAALVQTQANLAKAQSDLGLAETEYQRYQTLFEEGAVAQSDRDIYRNRVDQSSAAVAVAQQEVRSAENDIQVAEASISAAQAQKTQSSVDLEDTQLVSPIDGVVAYINIQEGEYWNTQYLDTSSSQNVTETAPIVVVDPSTYEVELEIQSDEANAVRAGQKAYVVLEEAVSAAQAAGASQSDLLEIAKERGSEGSVFAISPSQTPEGRGTKVSIRDFQQVRNLKVGGRVYVWIETAAAADAVVVPLGSVLARDQRNYVFVVNEETGIVQRREVTLGIESLNGVEIVSGVAADELIVTEGQNRLVDGTPVEIVNQEAGQ